MFADNRQGRDPHGGFRENVLLSMMFPSKSPYHLTKERFWTIVQKHIFQLRKSYLAFIADFIHEPRIVLDVADSAGKVVLSFGERCAAITEPVRRCVNARHSCPNILSGYCLAQLLPLQCMC